MEGKEVAQQQAGWEQTVTLEKDPVVRLITELVVLGRVLEGHLAWASHSHSP